MEINKTNSLTSPPPPAPLDDAPRSRREDRPRESDFLSSRTPVLSLPTTPRRHVVADLDELDTSLDVRALFRPFSGEGVERPRNFHAVGERSVTDSNLDDLQGDVQEFNYGLLVGLQSAELSVREEEDGRVGLSERLRAERGRVCALELDGGLGDGGERLLSA